MDINIITPFPQLSVENLIIRVIKPSDTTRLVHYFNENREYLTPWEPLKPDSFFTAEGWERKYFPLVELQRLGLSYYFLIFEEGSKEIVGIMTYNNIIQYPFHAAQLGYSLAQSAQGRGIMRRALKLSNQWLFDNLNLHRIIAAYIPRNKRSASVLKSVGFTIEGEAKDYLLINGQWEDHVLTSLINLKWESAQEKRR